MSSSRTDPLLRLKRRLVMVTSCCVVAVAACAWWALRVPPPRVIEVPEVGRPESRGTSVPDVAPVNPRAFEVAFWSPPEAPAPPPRPEAPPAPPPMRLQLLGIVHAEDGYTAALYDPEDDRVHIVANGDRISRCEVVRLAADEIELRDGDYTHVLRLREDPS